MMTDHEFENEIRKHQQLVSEVLMKVCVLLLDRAATHDLSKFSEPERSAFMEITPNLKKFEFGSKEYKDALAQMKPALDHHYAVNKHHPEFNAFNGFAVGDDLIKGMDFIDMIEMFADWSAAAARNKGGNFGKSVDINAKKFNFDNGVDGQLAQLFRNTHGLVEQSIVLSPEENK